MNTWHVTDRLAREYASGSVTEPDAWSLEKHVESCARCAALVSAAVRAGDAGPVLAGLRTGLLLTAAATPPARRPPLRLPARRPASAPRPRPTGAARLAWLAGPGLPRAWGLALLIVVAGAPALAYGAGFGGARPLLLLVAPLLPLAGVGLSYGRHADPLHEVVASTPSGGLRLLLVRTATVLTVSVPLLTAAGAVLPAGAGGPGAAAWLLPGLALTLAALALGSYTGCRSAAAGLGLLWLAVSAVPAVAPRPDAVAEHLALVMGGPQAQGAWAAAAVLCAGLLAVRRTSFDHLETM